MSHSLVSVILPTRNRLALLQRSVRSVLAQTLRDFELIVIDDGSDDGTWEWLNGVADARVRPLRRSSGSGAAAARNAGIRLARGRLLAFQDDDDVWLIEKLERQVAALSSAPAGTGWCLCSYIRLKSAGSIYIGGAEFWSQIDFAKGIVMGAPDFSLIATPAWLVERALVERAGLFDERFKSWDDWELALRLDQITRRIHVDEPLFLQDHILGSGMMKAERARAADLRIIMDKHGPLWAGRRNVLGRHYYMIGRVENWHDGPPAGRDALRKAVRLKPWDLRYWGALALAYVGKDTMRALTQSLRWMRGRRRT